MVLRLTRSSSASGRMDGSDSPARAEDPMEAVRRALEQDQKKK